MSSDFFVTYLPDRSMLGKMYAEDDVPRNDGEAFRSTYQAAEQGLPAAQRLLGMMYARGLGVLRNPLEARKWWQMAAAQGDLEAEAYFRDEQPSWDRGYDSRSGKPGYDDSVMIGGSRNND